MSSDYYTSPTTVGIIVVSDDIGVARMGRKDVLNFMTGIRFKKGLQAVEDKVNPTSELIKMYQKIFDVNGKQHVLIEDETFINKFSGAYSKYSDGYSKHDFAMLKEKYGIDEVLFVNASYGLLVKYEDYLGFVEIGKAGFCQIGAQIVDINNRKLKYRSKNMRYKKMERKWDSGGNYAYLEDTIWEAIMLAAKVERQAMLAIGN